MSFIQKGLFALLFFIVVFVSHLHADEDVWPKELTLEKHKLIIYQPQPESLSGSTLKALAAISVESNDRENPIFGAIWFRAQINIDKSENRAELSDFKLDKLRFPDEKDNRSSVLQKLIKEKMPHWSLDISYQKLLSSLEIKDMQKKQSVNIKTDAPNIIITEVPSILISIDGEARLKPIEKSKLFRVINTPFTIIMDSADSTYYLNADKNVWYSSTDVKTGYKIDKNVPKEVAKHQPKVSQEQEEDSDNTLEVGAAPEIVVVTEPTELISCDGKPEFTPISETGLMYVSNTESDLFMQISTQQYYLLLAGRWFESKNLHKGWKYIKSTALPKGFSQIPSDSDSSNILYAVSGTSESKDAVLDAQIPQTASVDRNTATLSVSYDGDPEYKKIDGTSLSYLVNTQTPVILANKRYYACDNAIWFVANNPYGVWSVATSIPEEIYTIPTSSPLYNVTFVKVYKVTDDTVYVGYTSGYTNTYIYNTTIVYGTGYVYQPWYGTYYYPRPVTWGFHVRWSPYYGWGFGMSYSTGPFTFMIGGGGWYGHGFWGPAPFYRYGHGYHRGYHNGYRRGYIHGRLDGNNRPVTREAKQRHRNNLYNSKVNKSRVKNSRDRAGNRFKSSNIKQKRSNNVYADRNGGIHRKVDNSWQQRSSSGWDKSRPSNTSRQNSLNRSFESRNRGSNFSRGSFSGGHSRGSSRARGLRR
ncbi:MAG: hypothetical protein U9P71_06070 [Campylobacterota bacterium]|nr:hypothetical protein [Campylobacterota bacterium]